MLRRLIQLQKEAKWKSFKKEELSMMEKTLTIKMF